MKTLSLLAIIGLMMLAFGQAKAYDERGMSGFAVFYLVMAGVCIVGLIWLIVLFNKLKQ